jgi:RHS repeat-associated protein
MQFPGDQAVSPTTLRWDGTDAYGRPVNGSVKAKVHVQFVYSNAYAVGPGGGGGGFGSPPPAGAVAFTSRYLAVLQKVWEGTLGSWDHRAGLGLGGWSLSPHHVYDPTSGTLLLGSGERRAAATLGNVAKILPATRGGDFTKIGPGRIAVAPDGRVFVPYLRTASPSTAPGIIRILGTDGTFVDSIPNAGRPRSLALAPDGSIYYAEQDSHRVWRRMPDGTRTVFAGTGALGFQGDGGPATAARLCSPDGIALGPDGSLFIADLCNHRIRRVGLDGVITTYAGTGSAFTFVDDGALATVTPTPAPRALAFLPDGTLIFSANNLVRRVRADGRVYTVAGCRPNRNCAAEPTPATRLLFGIPTFFSLDVEPDGSVLISEPSRVYRVTLDGSLEVVAGIRRLRCAAGFGCDPLAAQEQQLAPQTVLEGVVGVAVAPDGTIYLAESFSAAATHVRTVRPALPGLSATNMLVAAADGREVYEFNAGGRHLRTLDGFTGRPLVVFDYDGAGLVTAVRDSLGNTTTIERNGQGQATAIVAPFGQRTELTLDGNGYLAQVEDPAGNRVQVTHTATGLLRELRDPRDRVYRFGYDLAGRLLADTAPDGGVKTLDRVVGDSGYAITLTSALGRTTTYATGMDGKQGEVRTVTDPAGLETRTWRTSSGEDSTRTPDGTLTVVRRSGDPRWGTAVSFPGRLLVRLPSGDSSVITNRRSTVRSDSANPFTVVTETDSTTINGQLWRTQYDAATQRVTSTSPAGRQSFTTLDSLGRVRVVRTPGLDSVVYGYDARGRLQQVQTGGRVASYTYDGAGRLATTTDPLGRTDSLFYDEADRLTRQVLPGGREIGFAYDSSGNLTSVTPPAQPAHLFRYTALDLDSVYAPPSVGAGTWSTQYRYDLDRQLTRILRPGGDSIVLGYEALTGRPSTVTFDRGTLGFSYSGSTGQLTGLTGPGSTSLGFTYDGFLPKTVTWGGPIAGSVGVSYDSDFRVTSQTVNGGNAVSFGYDADGLLTAAGALGIKRAPTTGFVERDSLSGIVGQWSYDPKGALASYTASVSSGDTVFRTSYVRDSLSRITELTEIVQGDTTVAEFTYDDAGRLETVTRNGTLTASYEYDGNGNRLELTTQGGTVTGTYDDQDRMTSYGSATYSYGRNGEVEEKVEGTDTTRYTYDALGNLTQVELPDGTEIEYVNDPQNRRIGKRVDGQFVQRFLWHGHIVPIAELDSAGAVLSRFVYATRVNVPDYLVRGGRIYRLVLDHLGSVRLVVNTGNDSVVQRLNYDEFGVVTQNTNPGFQPFGFAGGIYDSQTGLLRFGARDYDANTGRWTAKDPLGFGGQYANFYEYVDNDPINFTDPTGLQRLVFNGSELILYDRYEDIEVEIGRWPAVSGAPGSGPSDQNRRNFGPVPEGQYTIDPRKIDRYRWYDPQDYDWWGPAGRRAWGNWRVPLQGGPNVPGRTGGYFIHGGKLPGSAGCIDLTKYEDAFFAIFRHYRDPLPLTVDYPDFPLSDAERRRLRRF